MATFTTTGASVAVGGAVQTSGVTANDFGSPVTYTVTAADGTTQDYVVTVDETDPYIGMSYGGGVIAYLDYADGWYGLIASTSDLSTGIQWWNGSYVQTGATESGMWSGLANSDLIITMQGATATDYAAGLARACDDGGYTDWFLPTTGALQRLYMNRAAIGGFTAARYWSSSEYSSVAATAIDFTDGSHYNTLKDNVNRVRAVREF